jgi:WD40 repeat protein
VSINDFDFELRTSAHSNEIRTISFPDNYSDLFVTSGVNDIRIWNTKKQNELLRIQLQEPTIECLCTLISNDGTCIVSGWNDGKVRAFYPESGKLMYTIDDCHRKGVASIALSKDGTKLITGGIDSVIRIWNINKQQNVQSMITSLKEHKSTVTSITMNDSNTVFITSSADGSCVIWDLTSLTRINALFVSTNQFSSIKYHPDMYQLITVGSDRQITYWDAFDLSFIRVIEGSESEALTSISLSSDGAWYATSSNDKLIKVWNYDNGTCEAIGRGHSGQVTACAMTPDGKHIVSVGKEGAIMIWNMPTS